MSASLFIDVDTRKRVHQAIAEDLSYLLVGNTFQSPSYTLHQIQRHAKTRCPSIVESGKEVSTTRKGPANQLYEDTVFTLQQLDGINRGAEEFKAIGSDLKTRLERLRVISRQ